MNLDREMIPCTYAYVYACMHVYMCLYIYNHMYTCMNMQVHICGNFDVILKNDLNCFFPEASHCSGAYHLAILTRFAHKGSCILFTSLEHTRYNWTQVRQVKSMIAGAA